MQEEQHVSFRSPDQTRFHLAPPGGWVNDPNGPFFYKGLWHTFYQYLPGSSKWDWGLQWGHAVSADKVYWQHLPPAIVPTPAGLDQDGVFSGCACIDGETGIPVLLYTGVRLRSSPTCGPLPPPQYDLNLPFIESQLVAWPADPEDPLLQVWVKGDVPILSLPPANMDLAGWRDPYIISTPSTSPDGTYKLVLGSGIKGKGGLVLVYKSKQLTHGWEFDRVLCEGRHEGPTGVTGIMWEMPLLVELPPISDLPPATASGRPPGTPGAQTGVQTVLGGTKAGLQDNVSPAAGSPSCTNASCGGRASVITSGPQAAHHPNRFFFSVSPDACTSPTLYWLGNCPAIDTFDVHDALGPFKLDLGDILYAPNIVKDPQGRVLIMAWQQEKRKVGEYSYAGCLSLARTLSLDYSDPSTPHLVQQPLPELVKLRIPGKSFVLGAPELNGKQPRASVDTNEFTAHHLHEGNSGGSDARAAAGWQESGRAQRHAAMMVGEYGDGEHALTRKDDNGQRQGQQHTASDMLADHGTPVMGVIGHRDDQALQQHGGSADDCVAHVAVGPYCQKGQRGKAAELPAMVIGAGQSVAIPVVRGAFLDIEIALLPANSAEAVLRPKADTAAPVEADGMQSSGSTSGDEGLMSGLALRSWVSGGSAAVLYSWRTGVLEVVFEATEPGTRRFSLAAPDVRRVGGQLKRPPAPGQPLQLRLLLDGSLLEIFTGEGEVLSTRVYRGVPPPVADGLQADDGVPAVVGIDPVESSGVDLISVGGGTVVQRLEAHEMSSIFQDSILASPHPTQAPISVEELLEAALELA